MSTSPPDTLKGGIATPPKPVDELSVHMQEYQMLTTRNTQWLALQNGTWIILAAFIGLLLQLADTLGLYTIAWLALVSVEVATLAYSGIGCESYNNVFYMETTLRPRIRDLTSQPHILCYESFVQRNRPLPQWMFDYGLAIIITLVVLYALCFYSLPLHFQKAWTPAMLILLLLNWGAAYQAASARRRIPVDSKCAHTGK